MSRAQLRGWPEGSLKSRSSRVYGVTNMFSAEQTNPHTHSARFQATKIRTDSSEVSATSGEPDIIRWPSSAMLVVG